VKNAPIFVEPTLPTGSYYCKWQITPYKDGEPPTTLSGNMTLDADRIPICDVYGEVPYKTVGNTVSLPQIFEYPELFGVLENNMDLVLHGARLEPFMLDSGVLVAGYAAVGLSIRHVPGQQYTKCRVQVTGLDALFGRPPLRAIEIPVKQPFLDATFSATGDPLSTQFWSEVGIEVRCSYDLQTTGLNPYHHELKFFPIVTFKSTTPLTLVAWLDSWLDPLVWLTTLSTGRTQMMSWLGLKQTTSIQGREPSELTAQVFGPGISQEPYESRGRLVDDDGQPVHSLISLASDGVSLLALLRRARELAASDNPFPELYRLTLTTELPERARFLYLVQALEGLHGFENRMGELAARKAHQAHRLEILSRARESLDARDIRYLRETWTNRLPGNLERVMDDLVAALPHGAAEIFHSLSRDGLVLRGKSSSTAASVIREIRNGLAHGSRGYAPQLLRPWSNALDTLARAHMLRLLGCPAGVIQEALGQTVMPLAALSSLEDQAGHPDA
jgi:hypothetical protein